MLLLALIVYRRLSLNWFNTIISITDPAYMISENSMENTITLLLPAMKPETMDRSSLGKLYNSELIEPRKTDPVSKDRTFMPMPM